ncbi:Uncharacterised protein [Vibrio cholerae]|nr:Uncharacterised protein [Vibrio cholerae]CSI74773.1 Uncharacterised protein [Vibrio cholerae]
MNTRLFNVLHDAANHHALTVTNRIHVHFGCIIKEAIQQNW